MRNASTKAILERTMPISQLYRPPAPAVLDDAVRRHRDEDGAAQGRVLEQLLELVISVMPDLADELHGVAELLVLGVRQSDRDLLGDRVDLGSSEVIDKHLLDLSR